MSGKCIYCGFVGTNDEMMDHAGVCHILNEPDNLESVFEQYDREHADWIIDPDMGDN